jgi:type I restriction enzyme S subunit
VDLLTTGVDIPQICNLVFVRRVNSRILYDQMIGRATRPAPQIGKESSAFSTRWTFTPICRRAISKEGLANSSARILPAGTVCLSRTASVGYVTLMGVPMATSQDFATWTCTAALHPKYLMYALMAEGDDIKNFGEGSTHTTIYFPEIRAFNIALAPFEEQQEIVRRIENALTKLDRLGAETRSAAALLDRLDQAILAKAFRGELVPQDPNDEPASVLLDRIRAGRSAQAKRAACRRRAN